MAVLTFAGGPDALGRKSYGLPKFDERSVLRKLNDLEMHGIKIEKNSLLPIARFLADRPDLCEGILNAYRCITDKIAGPSVSLRMSNDTIDSYLMLIVRVREYSDRFLAEMDALPLPADPDILVMSDYKSV